MAKKEELKQIPGFSQGVRENSAVRMVKLGRPICPHSKIEMERDSKGVPRPKYDGPNPLNCQSAGGEWWKMCEDLGHNPYFTTTKWYTTQDVIEEKKDAEGNGTGVFVKTGEDLIPHEEVRPNIAQVAISIRINSGKGAIIAVQKKGFKRLPDLGYFDVCQFRNCQKPVQRKWKSQKYGAYCSKEHLALIAADAESIALEYPHSEFNAEKHVQAKRRRQRQLDEALMGAFDGSEE